MAHRAGNAIGKAGARFVFDKLPLALASGYVPRQQGALAKPMQKNYPYGFSPHLAKANCVLADRELKLVAI